MIQVETRGLNELLESLHNVADNLGNEVYAALGKAGTKTRSLMAKEVQKELNVKQKVIGQNIKLKKNRESLTVTAAFSKSSRIALQHFGSGAKQTKLGVKAKISKTKGMKTYRSAFIPKTKASGNVFKRKGKKRLPFTTRLRGPSPWGVLRKNPEKMNEITTGASDAVRYELGRRIRYVELKKTGGLNWQQNTEE